MPLDAPLTQRQQRALDRTPRQAFRHALVQSVPFLIVIVPFGLLFGVVAAEAGLTLAQTLGFSTIVLAGASQFTAVQLLSDNAPLAVIVLSALAVNLRMAMYSASMVPWLGQASGPQKLGISYALIDQTYALASLHFENNPRLGLHQRLAYFAGTAVAICPPWVAATFAGARLGRSIPDSLALDFAVPITFLAIIAPALRTVPHVAAAIASAVCAVAFSGLPHGLGLLAAAPPAMLTGAGVELWLQRRKGQA